MRIGWWRGIGVMGIGLAWAVAPTRADGPKMAEYFGFRPPEIYKLDARIGNLVVRDLDGDKVEDIAIINNGRSRIDLLLSGKGAAETEVTAADEANPVPSDRRMRLRSLPVNKEVVSLQAGDFDGDGKVDLAYYGTPAELIVLFNQGGGKFGRTRRIATGEASEGSNVLAVGDLNRDGRDDLALLAPTEVVAIFQGEKGVLGEPERLSHTATNKPILVRAVDLDGDGGDDLVIWSSDEAPIRVRFSVEGGKLGPEQRFTFESIRAIAFANLDGKAGAEVLTIETQSGRARVLTLDESEEEDAEHRRGRLVFYPLPQGTARGRSLATGDLDGDGRADVVVTDPANAQFFVYRQGAKGVGLGASLTFPGLVGGRTVRAADFDGDGKAEVIVLSEQEKQIARSVLENGRLTFPAPLPIAGAEPVALEVADLNGDRTPEILYITRGKDEKGFDAFALRALTRERSKGFVPYRWGADDAVTVRGLSGAPAALRVVDANRDGQPDVLVFNSFGPPVLLLGRPGEPPAPAGGGLGPLIGAAPAGVAMADVEGPALIVAQGTYARNVLLDKDGRWEVKDQYNAGRSSAQVLAAAVFGAEGDGTKEVALLDRTSKSLLYLARKDGVYRPAGALAVGPLADFQGLHVADLDGDGKDDLLLAGTDKFGVVLTGRKGQRLKTLASYEPVREEAKFGDLIAGDLNGDGQPDLALTDVAEHFIEIVTYAGEGDLQRALSFKIFEQKSFRDVDGQVEPRDIALGDVDGDGRTDLVLIVHDRVLVYRQDPGKEDRTAGKP